MSYEQPPLDLMPDPPPKREPREIKGIQYRRYKVKNLVIHCDVCVAAVAASWGKEPTYAPNRAIWRRVTSDGEQMLCAAHAEEQRRKDEG